MHEPIGSVDALFGADGTQLPDPPPVMPDALTGPTFGADPRASSPVPLPAVPDADAIREAVAAALAEDPAPPPPETPRGRPVRRPPPRRRAPGAQPAAPYPPAAAYPQRGGAYRPPVVAAPRTVQPAPPGDYRRTRAQRPLGGRSRTGRGSPTGCVVTLIFLAVVMFTFLGEFADVVADLFR